ncbi:MAG: Ig-like domain-containing protein [Gammaproteobacteria bacterium]|nr:Ig-like domain-containing protein [Gammaproteobacteria bacterium]
MTKIRMIQWLAGAVFLALTGSVHAQTLVAVADSYQVLADQTLVIEPLGVLENDTDSTGEQLPPTATAELISGVTHGNLFLSSDGGFTYTPDSGFLGTDTFTYRVVDGVDFSDPVAVTLTVSGCSGAAPILTCWIESSYLAKLTELGYGSFQEGFEDEAAWGTTRTTPAPSVVSGGITWQANYAPNGVQTGPGAARSGLWGFYSNPHGIRIGNPTDPQRDGFIGTAPGGLVAVGGWLESNTTGARVQFQLDGGAPITFDDPTVTSTPKFFGVIDTGGFTTFELYEAEGVVAEEKFIFADDFTFGDAARPTVSLRVNGQHPDPPVVLTPGPVLVTLSMDPGQAIDPLDWYFGILVQNQLYWFTPPSGLLSTTPAPLATLPPMVLQDLPLGDWTLPDGTVLTFVFLLMGPDGIVSFDFITVGVSAGALP